MIIRIAKWILKLVDFDMELAGDLLTLTVTIGGVVVFRKTFDLIPVNEGIKRSVK